MSLPTAITLKEIGILEISGPGASELLQGQLTIDVEKISPDNSQHGAICNIKGRVISSFVISQSLTREKEFWLIVSKDLIDKTITTLKKYAPFYDVSIQNISSNWTIEGIDKLNMESFFKKAELQTQKNTLRQNNLLAIRSLNKAYLIVYNELDKVNTKAADSPKIWDNLNISALNSEVCLETSEVYTPHELNYHLNGRIDFEKGCYTGQEIVARMNYRAKSLPQNYYATSFDVNLKLNMTITQRVDKTNTVKPSKLGSIININVSDNKSHILVSMKESVFLQSHLELDEELVVKETGSNIQLKK